MSILLSAILKPNVRVNGIPATWVLRGTYIEFNTGTQKIRVDDGPAHMPIDTIKAIALDHTGSCRCLATIENL